MSEEIEKLRTLQKERQALRNRMTGKVSEKQKKIESQNETQCPECGSRQLVHDYERAELVCQQCGLVIMQNLSTADQKGVLLIMING
jgi:transcription initiation factor TFIIB